MDIQSKDGKLSRILAACVLFISLKCGEFPISIINEPTHIQEEGS